METFGLGLLRKVPLPTAVVDVYSRYYTPESRLVLVLYQVGFYMHVCMHPAFSIMLNNLLVFFIPY